MVTRVNFVFCLFYLRLKKTKTESQPPPTHPLPGRTEGPALLMGTLCFLLLWLLQPQVTHGCHTLGGTQDPPGGCERSL